MSSLFRHTGVSVGWEVDGAERAGLEGDHETKRRAKSMQRLDSRDVVLPCPFRLSDWNMQENCPSSKAAALHSMLGILTISAEIPGTEKKKAKRKKSY